MGIDQVEIIWRISLATSLRCNYLITVSYNLESKEWIYVINTSFFGCLKTAEESYRTSFCHFIRHLQSSKFRPFLICTALLFSANSYGDEYYQVEKIHVDHEQDSAILSFSGSPPEILEGYENYIIYNFNLTIGKKEYRLTEHDNYSHLLSKMKLGDLDYPVDNFPESRLVFSFSLSFTDFIIEARKCASKYSNFFSYLWDIWFDGDLAACNKNAWDAYWKKQNFIIDVTPTLKRAISKEIQSMTKEVSLSTSHFPMLIVSSDEYDFLHTFPSWANYSNKMKSEFNQSIVVYNAVANNYFNRDFTSLTDAYDRVMLFKHYGNVYYDHHYTERTLLLIQIIKSFESDECNDRLLKSPLLAVSSDHSRHDLIAKDYVSYLCQYGEFSFNKSAVPPPEKPKKAKNIKSSGEAYSDFKPYIYCRKYRCVIHTSETLYYKLVTYDYYAYKHDVFEHINSHLVRGHTVRGICNGYCAISDVDGLEKYINTLTSELSNRYNANYSWLIIKYDE